jgi:PPE-repeat protein
VAGNSIYAVTAGLRLYFGPDKSLIRRHREDDPRATGPAYERAFIVPLVVSANRTHFTSLGATNPSGQNTPATLSTEAQYLQMWAP